MTLFSRPPALDERLLRRACQPGRVRGIALDTYRQALERPLGANGLFRRAGRDARALHSRERRLVTDAWRDLPRLGPALAHALDLPLEDLDNLWLGYLVWRGLDPAHAQDTAAPSADRQVPFTRALDLDLALPEALVERCAVACAVGHRAAQDLTSSLGTEVDAFAAANLLRAPLDVRVRAADVRPRVLQQLQARIPEASPCPLSPLGIRLPPSSDLRSLPLVKSGVVQVQDEASQLIAALVHLQPGQTVLDLCAGAGGKTLAMAHAAPSDVQLYATDVREHALEQLRKRLHHNKIQGVKTAVLREGTLPKRWPATHDVVLADAPCSGSGTWRRNPAQRWRLHDLDDTLALQREVLSHAATRVAPGGRLIYATCSVLREENEQQVAWFLKEHPEFQLGRVDLPASAEAVREGPYVRTWPHRHGCDGFFGAALDRL